MFDVGRKNERAKKKKNGVYPYKRNMYKKETKTPFEEKGKGKKKGQEEESYHLCGGNPLKKKKKEEKKKSPT